MSDKLKIIDTAPSGDLSGCHSKPPSGKRLEGASPVMPLSRKPGLAVLPGAYF